MRSPTTAETFWTVVQSSGKTRENDSMALVGHSPLTDLSTHDDYGTLRL